MTHLLQRDPEALRRDVRTMDEDAGLKVFSNLAADLSIELLIGSLAILRGDGKIANRSLLFAPDGTFTVATGKAHWEILLRARAIETGAYVIAPAQGGHHEDGRKTWGRSMIIGPWGEVAAKLDNDEPGFICADIDRAKVAQARKRIPAWRGSAL